MPRSKKPDPEMSADELEALRILGIEQKKAKEEAYLLRCQTQRDSIYTALFRAEEELTLAFRIAGSDPSADNIETLQRRVETLSKGTIVYLQECARVNAILRRLGSFAEKAHDTQPWLILADRARAVYASSIPRVEKWVCAYTRTVYFVTWRKTDWDGTEKSEEDWKFSASGYTISETGDFQVTALHNHPREYLAGFTFQGRS